MLLFFENHDGTIVAINMALIDYLQFTDGAVWISFTGTKQPLVLTGAMAKAVVGALRKHGINADDFVAPNETPEWPLTDLFSSNGADDEEE